MGGGTAMTSQMKEAVRGGVRGRGESPSSVAASSRESASPSDAEPECEWEIPAAAAAAAGRRRAARCGCWEEPAGTTSCRQPAHRVPARPFKITHMGLSALTPHNTHTQGFSTGVKPFNLHVFIFNYTHNSDDNYNFTLHYYCLIIVITTIIIITINHLDTQGDK